MKLKVNKCCTIADNRVMSIKVGRNIYITDYIVSKVHNTNLNSLRQRSESTLKDLKENKDYIILSKENIKENKIILRSCGFNNTSLDRTTKLYLYGVKAYERIIETITNLESIDDNTEQILLEVFNKKIDKIDKIQEEIIPVPCDIKIEGHFTLGDKTISIVKGGFGPDKNILSELQVAELHEKNVTHIRQAVQRIEHKLIQGVDYLDLKNSQKFVTYLDMFGYTKQQRTAKHFYIFSERGYLKLIKHFNDDESWNIFEELLEKYFNKSTIAEETTASNNTDRANALLMAIEGKTVADRTIGLQKYTELLTSDMQQTIDAQNLLIDTIVSDDSIYAVSLVGRVLKSYNPKVFGKVKIFEMMRASGILISSRKKDEHNTPHYSYSKYFEVKLREIMLDNGDKKVVPKTYFNAKGLEWFLKRVSKEGLIDKSKIKEIKDIIVNVDKTSLAA